MREMRATLDGSDRKAQRALLKGLVTWVKLGEAGGKVALTFHLQSADLSPAPQGEYDQQDRTVTCRSSYDAGLIRAITGQLIGQSSVGFRQPVAGGAPGTLDTQHSVRCQFAKIVAGCSFGDHEQLLKLAVADSPATP
jgi:hypothetical protein